MPDLIIQQLAASDTSDEMNDIYFVLHIIIRTCISLLLHPRLIEFDFLL